MRVERIRQRLLRCKSALWSAAFFCPVFPNVSAADASPEEWVAMARNCETVIIEQSFEAFENYEQAPFTSGKPGQKEYSIYSTSGELVVIARVSNGDWDHCYVRESEEDRDRTRDFALAWPERYVTLFPASEYIWGSVRRPDWLSPVAIRCSGEAYRLTVRATLEADFWFRIVVTSERKDRWEALCREAVSG